VPVRARVARRAGAAAARTGWRPPHADRARFGFDGQPPEILVQLIDGERSLGEGERAACIGAREARAGDALEQVDVAGAQPAQIAIGPAIVAACERLLSDCGGGSGGSDPLNVLFWQYGEGQPMNGHVADDTHWGHYSGWVPRANQWICGDSDGAIGNYTVNTAQSFTIKKDTVAGRARAAYTRTCDSGTRRMVTVRSWTSGRLLTHHEHIDSSAETV
jgi:hypothetical protein